MFGAGRRGVCGRTKRSRVLIRRNSQTANKIKKIGISKRTARKEKGAGRQDGVSPLLRLCSTILPSR